MLNVSIRALRILRHDLDLVLDQSKHNAGSAPSVRRGHEPQRVSAADGGAK